MISPLLKSFELSNNPEEDTELSQLFLDLVTKLSKYKTSENSIKGFSKLLEAKHYFSKSES